MPDTFASSQRGSFRALPSFRLHRLARASERMAELEYLRLFGLSLPECRVIGVAGARPRTPFRQLCIEAELEKAHASRIVARLVERGLVAKQGDPADQRATILSLTAQGRTLHRDILAAAEARNARWLAPLTEAQRRDFLATIDLLLSHPPLAAAAEPAAPVPDAPVALDAELARALHAALGAALAGT